MPRAPQKRDELLTLLRARITAGDWGPGVRLPTREEIRREYGVSHATLQRVFTELARGGFIEARGASGTVVSEFPPNRCRYVFAFQAQVGDRRSGWGRYQEAIARAVARLPDRPDCRVASSYGLGRQYRGEHDGFRRLCEQVRNHELGGVIFTGEPGFVRETPIADEPGIGRVAINTWRPRLEQPLSRVNVDFDAFYRMALRHLWEADCRRVAFVVGADHAGKHRRLAEEMGLRTESYYTQIQHPSYPQGARNAAHLLMRLPAADRPDAIIIGNDHLAESTLAGITDAGLLPGEDVQVVAHWNFGGEEPPLAPVSWLGFEVGQVVAQALRLARAMACEGAPEETVRVGPVFREADRHSFRPALIDDLHSLQVADNEFVPR